MQLFFFRVDPGVFLFVNMYIVYRERVKPFFFVLSLKASDSLKFWVFVFSSVSGMREIIISAL